MVYIGARANRCSTSLGQSLGFLLEEDNQAAENEHGLNSLLPDRATHRLDIEKYSFSASNVLKSKVGVWDPNDDGIHFTPSSEANLTSCCEDIFDADAELSAICSLQGDVRVPDESLSWFWKEV